ncbi:hypothetical protein PsorP6_001964 [Peronosclerospora sorghi]|uniref:Uncharacterized protein n=1 Tax=Peronosclerospora sorghi TaxID=230839 RepID=A0ACC0WQS5_9STRA|nr:hypothetical protein PsorP6_001964 [Peronosclerospora sorghi]
MDMDNLGENQPGVSVEIDGPVTTLEPDMDQFMEQARVLKRDGREPTPSDNPLEEAAGAKRQRTGLRDRSTIRKPKRYDDYVMSAFAATRVLGPSGKPILASQLKLPRNNREASRSKFADLFQMTQAYEGITTTSTVPSSRHGKSSVNLLGEQAIARPFGSRGSFYQYNRKKFDAKTNAKTFHGSFLVMLKTPKATALGTSRPTVS